MDAGSTGQTDADKPSAPTRRVEGLDVLRFLAAFAVLVFHYFYRSALEGGFLDTSFDTAGLPIQLFYLGVDLFFMISGFVIFWTAEGRSAVGFGLSRFKRLYPAYLAAMSLTALLAFAWASDPFPFGLKVWLANLTMFAPALGQPFMDGAYWSIVLELIFYGWVALGLLAGILPRHTEVVVGAWLLISLADTLLMQSGIAAKLFLTVYAGFFAFGIITYRIWRHGVTHLRLSLALLAFLSLFPSAERERLHILANTGTAPEAGRVATSVVVIVTLFLLAIIVSARPQKNSSRISRAIAIGAGVSYPLYLIHQHAGYILINALAPLIGKWPAAVAAIAIVLGTSWLIWRYLEPVGRRSIDAIIANVGHIWRLFVARRIIHTQPAE